MGEKALNIIGTLTVGAIVVAIFASRNTPNVIRSFGTAYAGAVRAATGRR